MIPIKSMTLILSILAELRLIPKCQIITKSDMTVLEDELVQLNNINTRQTVQLTTLQQDFKNIEKQYQDIILSEQEIKKNLNDTDKQYVDIILRLENSTKKLQKEKEEITAERDIANQQYLVLQDQATEATELSIKLKEALTKWTS